jgi:hypothetical protein
MNFNINTIDDLKRKLNLTFLLKLIIEIYFKHYP